MTTSHKTKWREARIRIPKIGGEMMQGSEPIDNLMMPVLVAIKRHIENQDAITDIYNRAYEALMIGMDVNSDRVKELEKELAALKEAQLKDPFKMTEDELREFLSANGYDYDDLRRRGSLFIANLKNKLFQPPEAE